MKCPLKSKVDTLLSHETTGTVGFRKLNNIWSSIVKSESAVCQECIFWWLLLQVLFSSSLVKVLLGEAVVDVSAMMYIVCFHF